LLQRPPLRSSDETPDQTCMPANGLDHGEAGCLRRLEAPFRVSATVARFVDRLARLSPQEWDLVQHGIGTDGAELTMLEASRNAAVALAVRDLISSEQFDHLYEPFVLVIPVESLDVASELD
jgi:hypothetical protein